MDPSREHEVPDLATVDIPARQALNAFFELLDQLNARDKMLFNLRFIEGFNLPQIAEAVGISVSTTKRQLARIRKVVGQRIRKDPALLDYASRAKTRAKTRSARKPRRAPVLKEQDSPTVAARDDERGDHAH